MIIVNNMKLLAILPVVFALISRGFGQCTQQRYDACVELIRINQGSVLAGIVPTIEPDVLEEHCDDIDEAYECIEDFVQHCHIDTQRTLRGYAEAYEWICREGADVYREHAECLHQSRVQEEGQKCNETWHDRIEDTVSHVSASHVNVRICQYMNDYLDCVQNAVDAECGTDASVWMREFDSRLLQPIYEGFGCIFHEGTVQEAESAASDSDDSNGDKHYHYTTDYGVVAFLVVLIIILVSGLIFTIALFFIMRRKYMLRLKEPVMQYRSHGAQQPNGFNNPIAENQQRTPNTGASGMSVTNAGYDQPSAYPGDPSKYARFENETATTAEERPYTNLYASPEEVDITSGTGGLGQYDLSLGMQTETTRSPDPVPGQQEQQVKLQQTQGFEDNFNTNSEA